MRPHHAFTILLTAGLVCAGMEWYEVRSVISLLQEHTPFFQSKRLEDMLDDGTPPTSSTLPKKQRETLLPSPNPIPRYIEGVKFFYSTQKAEEIHLRALMYILDNIPVETEMWRRRKQITYIRDLSFHPMFGVPDSEQYGEYQVIDEKRAEAILEYLQHH